MDNQAVQLRRDLDLAAQPAPRRPAAGDAVEQFFLEFTDLRQLLEPGVVHDAVARRADALPATHRVQARDARVHRSPHDARTDLDVGAVPAPAALDIDYEWHAGDPIPCGDSTLGTENLEFILGKRNPY